MVLLFKMHLVIFKNPKDFTGIKTTLADLEDCTKRAIFGTKAESTDEITFVVARLNELFPELARNVIQLYRP